MRHLLIAAAVLILFTSLVIPGLVLAAECSGPKDGDDDKTLQSKIEECQKLISTSVNATKPHEEKLKDLERDIAIIDANVQTLTTQITKKQTEIATNEQKLGLRHKLLETQVRDHYKKDYQSPFDMWLSGILAGSNVGDSIQVLGYRQSLINQQKQLITTLVIEISDLAKAKKQLEETQRWLSDKRASLQTVLAPIRTLVSSAKSYQTQLTNTVGTLSARQKQLLAEKTGNFSTSVGDVPQTDDPASRPDFNPGFSPAFAAFSFGAPHRKGMSQYGAYGRAKEGQNYEQILAAYYPGTELKSDHLREVRITVSGYGDYAIEDYVKRIYEVPNSWGDSGGYEALKAQAVAARSYALAYTNNGSKPICATESCQVFQPNAKGGNWERAVNDTSGKVLVSGGNPHSAYYAASSGGYNTPGGWDTKCGNQSCWTGDAYEKIAGSPWFYKAWYKPRGGSGSRSHPWLTKEEFVDIINATLLYIKDRGNLSHLGQTDKANPDTWSRDEVRSRLGGDAISEVSSVSVSYSTGGYTSSVIINGHALNGSDFREVFNIRAPGEIYLPSSLFDIMKK